MQKSSVVSGAAFALSISLAVAPAQACTWFGFINDEGKPFIGRTMEWPGDLGAEIAQVPRGYKLGDIVTEYGFVGMYHGSLFSDGINEHGVAISALWLESSQFAPESDAARKNIDLIHYTLGNSKTVDEALEFIRSNAFYA